MDQEKIEVADHYNANDICHINTSQSADLAAFSGALQPGLYSGKRRHKFANATPLGLGGFALTTFVLSLLNLSTRGVSNPGIVIGPAFAYGGLVQLLAGMWEMAIGNTFGATALSSYGGFWISFAIITIPGSGVSQAYEDPKDLYYATAFLLFVSPGLIPFGFFIFTVLLTLCTMKSTVIFFSLFLLVDITFLTLGLAHLFLDENGEPQKALTKASGIFGLLASFTAWYVMYAGIAERSNSFLVVPVLHFPWSEKGRNPKGV